MPRAARATFGTETVAMNEKSAGIEEILATFSSHITKSYPSPESFRKNFDLLLGGKRGRLSEADYGASLEKNIVYLNELVGEAEALVGKLLDSSGEGPAGAVVIADELNKLEHRAHERTASAHRAAFIEGEGAEFKELFEEKKTGGPAYLDKLEFNYRYLMTLRIFLFEFLTVLAAIRSEYRIAKAAPLALQRVRNHIEVTAHYYLGNVAVAEAETGEAGGPADPVN
jgi:hypothetical protein